MAVQPAVAQEWKEKTGQTILQGYGLTETSPVAICCKMGSEFDGSIGLPVPSTDVMIAGGSEAAIVEIGIAGEDDFEVMSKQIMQSLRSDRLKSLGISPHVHYAIEKMMAKGWRRDSKSDAMTM